MSMISNTTYKQDRPEEGVDCEMSPVVPMLTINNLIKTQDHCSESDQSEVLIPLVAATYKPSSAGEVNTNSAHLAQNTEMPEESQSLLPQLPTVETCKLTAPPEECLSSSSCSQTVLDFPMLSQNNLEKEAWKKDKPTKTVPVSKRYPQGSLHSASQKGLQSLLTGRIISNQVSRRPNQDNTQGGWGKTNNLNVQGNYSGKYTRPQYPDLNSEWSQQDGQHTEIEDEGITFSQIPLSQNVAGETTDHLVCSQRELTPSLTDKVCSKIEGLAGSLDRLPRKQMLVTEATLLQCISQLQDRLHKQLKKEQNVLNAYRRIIFTSQTGLSKVSEIHRKDKQSLNQSEHNNTGRMAHLSQSQKISVHTQAVKDLAKRQKKVLTLLKRQRCLVDSLKALKRSSSSGDKNKPVTKTTGGTTSVTKGITETTKVTKQPGNLNLVASGSTIHLSRSASIENGSKHSSQLSGINDQSQKRIHQMTQSDKSEETHVKNRSQKAKESGSALKESVPVLQAMTSVDVDKSRACEGTQLDNVTDNTARLVLQAAQSVGLERNKPKACESEQNNMMDLHVTDDFTQRQSTQNATQTTGVDLFADNDVDSVANTVSATGKANVGSDGVGDDDAENGGGMFTQDSDTGNAMNVPIIGLDDKIETTTGNDPLEKSEFAAKSNQQTTSNTDIDLHEDSKNSDKDVKKRNVEESDDDDTQAPEAEKVEISEKDETPEKSDKNAAEAIYIDDGDDDDNDSIVIPESQNVSATNSLKRKMESDATNDENVAMKTKRTEQVDDGKGLLEKSAATSYSESLWLNMLKNDSEKTKSGVCSTSKYMLPGRPEGQGSNQVFTASKLPTLQNDIEQIEKDSQPVCITNKVSSVQPEFDPVNDSPVQSQSSSQTLAPVNAINLNVNKQKSYALDDINKNGTCISASDVCKTVVELSSPQNKPDVLDYGAVNNDYHSPKPCSPVSMAVRGSPCETLNNESPGGSTVYNFMSKTKQPFGGNRQKSAGSDNKIKPGVSESRSISLLPRHPEKQNLDHSNQANDNTKNSLLLKISENQNSQRLMGPTKLIQPKFQLIHPPDAANVISNGNVKQFIIMNNRTVNKVPMSNRPVSNIITPAVTVTDTISDAINTVIQRSRETLADGDKDKNNSTKKQSSGPGMLPTLKELVQTGKLTPGKHVLSCNVKGIQQHATLTHFGKIRTSDGQTFNNVSAWLSTLYEGVAFKRRKSYETACYKGKPLLSYCKETEPTSYIMPTGVTGLHHTKTDSATQVDVSVFDKQSVLNPLMTEDEKRLSQLLSTSVVRILTNQDLVSNHDLPDNFWTEDFSKVTLTSDIWNCVTAW